MIRVVINRQKLGQALRSALAEIITPTSDLYRQVAFDLLAVIHQRIHVDGQNAVGKPIGNYTIGYVRLRTKKYNRGTNPTVILSLTRQLENDYAVVATERGWGIGFNNPLNAQKARWNDKRYGERIYDLTESELQLVIAILNKKLEDGVRSGNS